jgi:hypothetical protein
MTSLQLDVHQNDTIGIFDQIIGHYIDLVSWTVILQLIEILLFSLDNLDTLSIIIPRFDTADKIDINDDG